MRSWTELVAIGYAEFLADTVWDTASNSSSHLLLPENALQEELTFLLSMQGYPEIALAPGHPGLVDVPNQRGRCNLPLASVLLGFRFLVVSAILGVLLQTRHH